MKNLYRKYFYKNSYKSTFNKVLHPFGSYKIKELSDETNKFIETANSIL